MIGSRIQFVTGQAIHQTHHRRQRVPGTVRICGMPLFAGHREKRSHRPTSSNLYHVAHRFRTGRFTNDADAHLFTRRRHMVQQCGRAIDGICLFVTGDRDNNCTIRWGVIHHVHCCRHECSNPTFHIRRAAPIKNTVHDIRPKRILRPSRRVANGDNIRMTVKSKAARMALVAPTCEQVANATPICPRTFKTSLGQRLKKDIQCPVICRGHRGASHKACCQFNGITKGHCLSLQSVAPSPM